MERSAAKLRGPKPFEACAAGQTFCTRQTVAASLLLCLRGWNSGWGDLTLRHAPASATAVLGWTAVKVAAPSKDHLRGSSNTSLIALLVLMSVKHRSLRCSRCILVVVAQTDLALKACQQGAVHTHRCELKCSLQSRRRGSEGPFFPFFGI